MQVVFIYMLDKLYIYKATVLSVYDGDTFKVNLDLGLNLFQHDINIRLAGCNSIELREVGGIAARENLRKLLPVGSTVLLKSVAFDKYANRLNAEVYLLDDEGKEMADNNLIQTLITEGWVAPWNGKGTRPVPESKLLI